MKRPLLIVTISYILGIIIGVYFKQSILLILFAGITGSAFWKIIKKKKIIIIAICIVTCLLSFLQINNLNNKYNKMYKLDDENIAITGIVCSQIKETDYKYSVNIKLENKLKLTVYIDKKENVSKLEYGNKVSVTGTYKKPTEKRNYKGYDYMKYLKTKKICGSLMVDGEGKLVKTKKINPIFTIINKLSLIFKQNLKKLLPEQEAELEQGILLGDTSDIESDIKDDFRECNLSHMLAVSGAHLSYLVLGINTVLSKKAFGIRRRKILSIIFILIFMVIVNMSPSVVRAGISTIIAMFATLIYRKQDTYTTISIALLLTLLNNPFAIFDVGLQLSYLATLSIIIFYSKFTQKQFNNKVKKYLYESAMLTFSANILILPISIYEFNTIPINSVISNLLAGPLLGICIILGMFMVIISTVCFPVSKLIAFPLQIILKILIKTIELISKIPFGNYTVKTPWLIVVFLTYAIIATLIHNKKRITKILTIITLIIFIVMQVCTFINIDEKLKIYFIDVGQGDSMLVKTVRGKNILIDGGGSKNPDYDIGEKILVPYLLDRRIKTLDYVIISHFDEDHVGGVLTVMQELKVKKAIIARQFENSNNYKKFIKLAHEKKIKVIVVEAGDVINIEKEIRLRVLWPDSKNKINENVLNNNSLVCKLEYKNFSIMLTGDIEEIAEKAILAKYKRNVKILKSNILKVAHHGSKSSSTEDFIKAVMPEIALIGVGKDNSFGHPSDGTIERLNKIKCKILRTDKMGEIELFVNKFQFIDYLTIL